MSGTRRLLVVTDSQSWMDRGACVGADVDLWFPQTKRRRVSEDRATRTKVIG